MQTTRVELTPKFLVYAFVTLVLLLVGWELRGVLVSILGMVFVSYILYAGLRPMVESIEKWRIVKPLEFINKVFSRIFSPVLAFTEERNYLKPIFVVLNSISKGSLWMTKKLRKVKFGRPAAVLVIYVITFAVVVAIVVLVGSELVRQIIGLVHALPDIYARLVEFIKQSLPVLENILPLDVLGAELDEFVQTVVSSEQLKELLNGENILALFSETVNETIRAFSGVAGLLVGLITVVIVSIYMLLKKEPVFNGTLSLLPNDTAKSIQIVLTKIEASLGSWLVGQVSLMFIIGVITYFILLVPSFFDPAYELAKFAVPLALLAGLLEAVPTVGPAITLILACILAIGTSGLGVVVYIAISFTLLQNLEGVFIVPMVMKRVVGIDPILTVLGIIAGFQMAGVLGSILAIPMIGIIQIILVSVATEYKRIQRQRPKLI